MTIYFYGAKEKPYDCFSNFSFHGFELEGYFWKTNEHYFQAQKYVGTSYFHKVRNLQTPKEAAYLGRKYKLPDNWQEVRYEIMKKGVIKKFETHPDILQILLATGEEEIVENNPKDEIWACGAEGKGQNLFGKVLMDVRSILREKNREK